MWLLGALVQSVLVLTVLVLVGPVWGWLDMHGWVLGIAVAVLAAYVAVVPQWRYLFGLASVTVTTASSAGALEISGLEQLRARQLVDELTLKADAVSGDAT